MCSFSASCSACSGALHREPAGSCEGLFLQVGGWKKIAHVPNRCHNARCSRKYRPVWCNFIQIGTSRHWHCYGDKPTMGFSFGWLRQFHPARQSRVRGQSAPSDSECVALLTSSRHGRMSTRRKSGSCGGFSYAPTPAQFSRAQIQWSPSFPLTLHYLRRKSCAGSHRGTSVRWRSKECANFTLVRRTPLC